MADSTWCRIEILETLHLERRLRMGPRPMAMDSKGDGSGRNLTASQTWFITSTRL